MSLARSVFTTARQSVRHVRPSVSQRLTCLRTATPQPTQLPQSQSIASALRSHRPFSTSLRRLEDPQSDAASKGTPIGQIEQRLQLTFTCTVDECGHRSTHEFAKRSYEKGIVIVQCPGCQNRHLIADHLSWFTESPSEPKTVEQMVAEKGGRVRTGRKLASIEGVEGDQGETIEILSDSEADALEKSVEEQGKQQ